MILQASINNQSSDPLSDDAICPISFHMMPGASRFRSSAPQFPPSAIESIVQL
jgi:hypothetical protein